MRNTILLGDALAMLKTIPDNFVQTVVTSPPYFGLRSYIADGHPDKPLEIGLEGTPEAYIARLVEVFREVRRVLRNDGTLWLNLGDSYWNSTFIRGKSTDGWANKGDGEAYDKYYAKNGGGVDGGKRRSIKHPELKEKDLIGIPWMLAFALRADGWYLRSDIIWHKPNCMPESVEDRPTKSHEYLFLLSKNANYYYDNNAIREPHETAATDKRRRMSPEDYEAAKVGRYVKKGEPELEKGRMVEKKEGWQYLGNPLGRNKRTVWTVASQPYEDAHFATFPPKLIEPCILAGTSPYACEHCNAPWRRITEPTGHVNSRETAHVPNNSQTKTDSTGWKPTRRPTDQWEPTCTCLNDGHGQCIVLDPFMGAGTTALVALQHHRDYLGIELNPDYVELAKQRIATIQPVLWEVSA